MKKNEEKLFVEITKQTLNESAESLEGRVLSKLNQARQQALADLNENSQTKARQWWKPVTGLLAMAASVMIFLSINSTKEQTLPSYMATDTEIILSTEQINFFEELDFYTWLAEEEEANAG